MSPDPDPPRTTAPRRRPASAPAPRGPGPGCEIVLQNPCRFPDVRARRLRPWLSALVAELAPAATSFAVRFVGDREMRRLNRGYRGQDKTTDVLSFAAGEQELHLGDVAISIPTARRQAAAQGHAVDRELRTLVLHGVLHCLGHDHERDDGAMERLEARLRRRWLFDA